MCVYTYIHTHTSSGIFSQFDITYIYIYVYIAHESQYYPLKIAIDMMFWLVTHPCLEDDGSHITCALAGSSQHRWANPMHT